MALSEFIGRFHPVLVHLPIGILLLAGFFLGISRIKRYAWLMPSRPALNIILLLGMISAILSCVSGYLLASGGDYEGELVSSHQWMGISVAAASVLAWVLSVKSLFLQWQWMLGPLLTLLLIITGHQGGSLTHGEGFLSEPLANLFADTAIPPRKPIPNIQEALAYNDVVQPILQTKCYGCHGASKQKGKLRMDQQALLMKGGKNGEVIEAGRAIESEMIKRILLPRNDEHHMAPKEKPQVTEQETDLLQWWIDNGADFVKKVKDIPQPKKITPLLLALQMGNEPKKTIPDVPETPVEKANEAALQQLKDAGVAALPVAQNNNYLSASFVVVKDSSEAVAKLLLPLKKQLVWLNLGNTTISDAAMDIVAQCDNLTRLRLENTNITDKGVAKLSALKGLQSLNLVGTKTTAAGLASLQSLKHLQSIYLYQTGVQSSDWEKLKKIFPNAVLDTGGYKLPFIASDTVEVKFTKKP